MIERLRETRVIMLDWGGTLARLHRQEGAIDRCAAGLLKHLRTRGVEVSAEAEGALTQRFCSSASALYASDDLREFDTVAFLRTWARDNRVALPASLALNDAVDAAWRPWVGCLDLIGNAKASLRRLVEFGFTLGMVSNVAAPNHICRKELARLGIADPFQFAVFSSDIGWRKPSPKVFQAALTEARKCVRGLTTGQILFVGDTVSADFEGPSDMGFKTVLVRTGQWDGDEEALARKPDLIVDSIDSLPARLGAATDHV